MVDPIDSINSGVSGEPVATGSATGALTGESAMGKEEFLQLLVVQIQNQDPLEPMKNEAFVAQMAQFSSLEQLMNMNETMSQVKMLESSINNSQSIGLIGKNVSVMGNTIQMREGAASEMHYILEEDAHTLELNIFDDKGVLQRTMTLGNQNAGRHDFSFDGLNDFGEGLANGEYTFSIDAKDIGDNSIVVGSMSDIRVDGIVLNEGIVYLLAGNSRFRMSDIVEVRGNDDNADLQALISKLQQDAEKQEVGVFSDSSDSSYIDSII
jgi:flagellar basal-body rod modification protein FlgD